MFSNLGVPYQGAKISSGITREVAYNGQSSVVFDAGYSMVNAGARVITAKVTGDQTGTVSQTVYIVYIQSRDIRGEYISFAPDSTADQNYVEGTLQKYYKNKSLARPFTVTNNGLGTCTTTTGLIMDTDFTADDSEQKKVIVDTVDVYLYVDANLPVGAKQKHVHGYLTGEYVGKLQPSHQCHYRGSDD